MRVYGGRGKGNLGYVTAYLMCSNPVINNPIRFYIDTGASRTTIADRDAARLGLDYSQLEENQIPVLGIGCKSVKNYLLPTVALILRISQDSYHMERLPFVTVLKHEPENDYEREIIDQIPSLMGIDILRKYSVRFTKKHVVLEK